MPKTPPKKQEVRGKIFKHLNVDVFDYYVVLEQKDLPWKYSLSIFADVHEAAKELRRIADWLDNGH